VSSTVICVEIEIVPGGDREDIAGLRAQQVRGGDA
jgi:hypothetical protein